MAATELDELKRLGGDLSDAPFVCGGSVDPVPRGSQAEGVAVCYRDPKGQFSEILFPPQVSSDLEKLAEACAPATFGRGDQDVLDPTYRQAVKLDPNQFTTSFNIAEFTILAEVQRVIGGNVGGVRAILHKLNVYSTGGFFKAHRDTPRSQQCVGTIVVCLPTQFTGGEFVVKSADGSFAHTFDWGASTANGKVQWCAFCSDCEHEVLPVRSGHRVTLTYVIEHQPLQHPMLMNMQPFTAFGERLEELLKDPAFAPQDTKLGFGLQHQYVVSKRCTRNNATVAGKVSTDPEHVVVSGNDVAVPLMKGADRVLKETLDRLGLQYAFVPVYATNEYRASLSEHAERDRRIRREQDENYFGQTYDGLQVPIPNEWRFPFRTEGNSQGKWRGDGEKWLFVSTWDSQLTLFKAREIVWVVRPSNFPYLKTSIMYGNEHTLSKQYAAACLLVYIPPSDVRGAKKHGP